MIRLILACICHNGLFNIYTHSVSFVQRQQQNVHIEESKRQKSFAQIVGCTTNWRSLDTLMRIQDNLQSKGLLRDSFWTSHHVDIRSCFWHCFKQLVDLLSSSSWIYHIWPFKQYRLRLRDLRLKISMYFSMHCTNQTRE